MTMVLIENLLALDIGEKRIGLAIADRAVSIARPLVTLENSDTVFDDIKKVVLENNVTLVVAGYPRGLEGQTTKQTKFVEDFVGRLEEVIDHEVVLQDEALTSVKAEKELASRKKPYAKGDVDSLAATYILDDYISANIRESYV